MLDQLLQIIALVAVKDVIKVRSVGDAALAHLVREVSHELFIGLKHWPEPEHRDLVVKRHMDTLDIVEMQEGLLFCQDLLEEVLVDHVCAIKVNRAGTDLQSGGT